MNDLVLKQGTDITFVDDIDDAFDAGSRVSRTATQLSETNWELMQSIAAILEPINDAKVAICAERYPTISLMIPYFDSILESLSNNTCRYRLTGGEEADCMANGTESACDKLLKYVNVSSELA